MNAEDIAIIGASGYTGQELLRFLRRHPKVTRIRLASRQDAGQAVAPILRQTAPQIDRHYVHPDDASLKQAGVVFYATPNGTALHTARNFVEAGCRVIDLSADFRLKDAAQYAKWYGEPHEEAALLAEAVYGLVEINRAQIVGARLIANPGCYASAVQLGLIPLLQQGLITSPLIADVKSGTTGAGKKLETQYLYTEVNENFRAYAVGGHRHHPEIVQGLMAAQEKSAAMPELVFTPHLLPMQRGILATLHVRTEKGCSRERIREAYRQAYHDCPFMVLHPDGQFPCTAEVVNTNMVSLGFFMREAGEMMTVLVALDNMVKGAAGQAIQNFNVMMGWPETLGLIG